MRWYHRNLHEQKCDHLSRLTSRPLEPTNLRQGKYTHKDIESRDSSNTTKKQCTLEGNITSSFIVTYPDVDTSTTVEIARRNDIGIVSDDLSSTESTERQVEAQPLNWRQMDWYIRQTRNKNNEADGQLKASAINKTKKENLKHRKTYSPKVQFIQGNLQIELNKQISQMNKKEENFVCLVQEPYTSHSKIINQPNSVQKFAAKGLARAAIYISKTTPAWFIENLTNKDLVDVQIGLQDVLIVSAYMDIKNRTLETPRLC